MDSTLVQFDLEDDGIDLQQFKKNNMWDLLNISAEVKSQVYFSHKNPLSTVVYTIAVRRKSLFYVVNYIAPPVAISLLSMLLFLIPPEVGKRMGKLISSVSRHYSWRSARVENWPVTFLLFLCFTLAHENLCTHILVSLD